MTTNPTITPEGAPKVPDVMAEVLSLGPKIRAITEVRQVGGSFRVDSACLSGGMHNLQITQEFRSKAAIEGSVATVFMTLLNRALRTPEEPGTSEVKGADGQAAMIEIEAVFIIRYELSDAPDVSEAAVEAFGQINGRFNLTAYWREFVHSCCSRAGLPPIPVEPFNALRAIKALKKPDEGPAPSSLP